MDLVRWSPFRELETLQDRITRLFAETGPVRKDEISWVPAVDIFEDTDEIVVKAELPSMEEKDVEVKVENNILTIAGKKKLEREEKKEKYHLIESSFGSFSRSFSLPGNVEADKASAKFEKGVLTITLPKKEELKPKQIKINVH
jgi:HSP20 family protein